MRSISICDLRFAIVAALCLTLCACGRDYSNGSRVGVVTKLSQRGLFWKSWEGELNMGGVRAQQDSTVANVFEFNADEAAVPKIQEALRTGKRVELIYREWAIGPPSIGNDHVVIDVKEADR